MSEVGEMRAFRAVLALASVIALGGCGSSATEPGANALHFEAEVQPTDGDVVGVLTVSNPTAADVTLDYGGICAVALLLFDSPQMTGEPRWSQLDWWNARPGGCKWMPVSHVVPANGSIQIGTLRTGAATILGDSLAAGTYFAAVRLILAHWKDLPDGAWTVVVDSVLVTPAGDLELRGP